MSTFLFIAVLIVAVVAPMVKGARKVLPGQDITDEARQPLEFEQSPEDKDVASRRRRSRQKADGNVPEWDTRDKSPEAEPQEQPATAQAGFDLRQAVIAQTILNNDYISEIK